jgi:hypothetical protein
MSGKPTDYYSAIAGFNPQPVQTPNYAPMQSVDPTQMGQLGNMSAAGYGGTLGNLQGFGQPAQGQGQFNLATAGQGVGVDTSGGGGGFGDWLKGDGNLSTTFQGIQALSGAYLGFQQLKQAKDALHFQKQAYNTNLTNSVQSYNTSLADRINGRTSAHDGKAAEVATYLAAHSLKKPGG